MKSPFVISKEAQKKRDTERAKAFMEEYTELCKKHRLIHGAILQPTSRDLRATIVIEEYDPDKSTNGTSGQTGA